VALGYFFAYVYGLHSVEFTQSMLESDLAYVAGKLAPSALEQYPDIGLQQHYYFSGTIL